MNTMINAGVVARALDWVDRQTPWSFVALLYMARWIILVPVLASTHFLLDAEQQRAASAPAQWGEGGPLGTFFGLVIVPPLLETLLTCSLPYAVFAWLRRYSVSRPKRCWGFILVSAAIMVLLHPMLGAVVPAFVTGAFLAYCYAHFAPIGISKAILFTWLFHATINLVGWTMLVVL